MDMLRYKRNAVSLQHGRICLKPIIRAYKVLQYGENGQPEDVLRLEDRKEAEPGPGEVLVDWLAASRSSPQGHAYFLNLALKPAGVPSHSW